MSDVHEPWCRYRGCDVSIDNESCDCGKTEKLMRSEIKRLRDENAELRELLRMALHGLTHPFVGEAMDIVFPGLGTSWHRAAQKAAGGDDE